MSMFTTADPGDSAPPGKLNSKVKRFCRALSKDGIPVYLPFTDVGIGEMLQCHLNVATCMRLVGGRAAFGWSIFEGRAADGVLGYSAEFHSVWRSDEGNFYDITPRFDDEEFILFVPDVRRKFDWLSFTRPANICHVPATGYWGYDALRRIAPISYADVKAGRTPRHSVEAGDNLVLQLAA